MFNIETAITEWRQRMLAAGIQSPEPLDELESHLRDDVAQQISAGVDAQTAFDAAVSRLGNTSVLREEFGKSRGIRGAIARLLDRETNQSMKRKRRMVLWVATPFSLLWVLPGLVQCEMSASARAWGFTAMAVIISLVYGSGYICGFLPPIRGRRAMNAITAACGTLMIGWFAVFSLLILPRLDFTVGPLVVTVLWALAAGTLFGVLPMGLEAARCRETITSEI